MKSVFAVLFCAILFSNCQNEAKPIQNAAKAVDSTQIVAQKVYDRPTLLFSTTIDSMENPHSVVSFAYGAKVEKIDTAVGGNFALLESVEKKQLKLPKTYIVAGKAFWAGLQTIIAIDSTEKGYIIKRQYQDEQGSGKEPFEIVKSFPK